MFVLPKCGGMRAALREPLDSRRPPRSSSGFSWSCGLPNCSATCFRKRIKRTPPGGPQYSISSLRRDHFFVSLGTNSSAAKLCLSAPHPPRTACRQKAKNSPALRFIPWMGAGDAQRDRPAEVRRDIRDNSYVNTTKAPLELVALKMSSLTPAAKPRRTPRLPVAPTAPACCNGAAGGYGGSRRKPVGPFDQLRQVPSGLNNTTLV
jgi:hypothetical protein